MSYTTLPVAYNPGIDGEAGRIGDFYAPQWLANAAGGVQNLASNQYLLGGNTGWRLGNDLYAANQWMGEPIYGNSSSNPAYDNSFIRYSLTPDQIAQFNAGNAAYINGSPYDVLDQNGNVIRSGTWENIRNNSSTDTWDAIVTALVGGIGGAAAAGAGTAAGAGSTVGSGATGVGEGLANVGTLGAGGTTASGVGAMAGAGGIGAGAGSYAAGLGGALGGAAGAASGGTPPPSNPYYGSSGTSLQNILNGTGSMNDWLGLASTALGALGGSQGQQNSSTSSRAMDPRMDALFYSGLAPMAMGSLGYSMPAAQAAGNQMMSVGSGLLGQTAPNTPTNPYLKNQADDIQRRTAELLAQNNLDTQGNAVMGGSLGGSRQGVAQGVAAGKAADYLSGNLANLYGNAYTGDQNRLLQQQTLGAGLLSQGLNTYTQPLNNTASIFSPFTGFGTTTNSTQQGGGWQGAVGGALSGAALGHQMGWW